MREAFGNVWQMEGDALCITTNHTLKKDGTAVMGGGVAREAKERNPGIDRLLGQKLLDKDYGVSVLGSDKTPSGQDRLLLAFPTKDNVWDKSKYWLIERSAEQLVRLMDILDLQNVLLPRPGAGLGGLKWDAVKGLIKPILDDRVIIVGYATEKNPSDV